MAQPIVFVDVMNLAFRMGFAHKNLSCDGIKTGVVYGAVKTLNDLRETVSSRVVFCWDNGVPVPGAPRPRNWRDDILSTYKATRKESPEKAAIIAQLPDFHKVLCALGYSSVSVMGLEADDVIGILAGESREEMLIFSTDKDFYQCLTPRVRILVPHKDRGRFAKISADDVLQKYGIPVDRWADYLALGGDASDNIKPERGMGPKTAQKMILAGADPRKNFSAHSSAFRAAFAKYEGAWPAVQKSHAVALIPTRRDDFRVSGRVPSDFGIPSDRQHWAADQKEKCQKFFERFCADRDMTSLLAIRHQLFREKGEQCPIPQPPLGREPARRSVKAMF